MNVLILHLRGLHLGYLGCYGNEWVATPNLDALAAESIVCDRHYADHYGASAQTSPGPALALAAWLGEQGVPFRQILAKEQKTAGQPGRTTALAKTFRAAGGALDALRAQPRWGLWVELPSLLPPWHLPEEVLGQYFTGESDEDAADEDAEPAPVLEPWPDPPPGPVDATDFHLLDRLQYTYAAAVSQFDEELGAFLAGLSETATLDEQLLVVTSDRGLALGEHRVLGDWRPWLHEEIVHLPLLVRLPHAAEAGRRVPLITQSVDLVPTVCDALEIPSPATDGHSLLPLLRGSGSPVRAYACTRGALAGVQEGALRTPDWAFLLPEQVPPGDAPRAPQLYVKPDDRWEVNNVIHHHPEVAEELEQTLRAQAPKPRAEKSG